MSQSDLALLPIRFDPLSFADHSSVLDGLVAIKQMGRLLGKRYIGRSYGKGQAEIFERTIWVSISDWRSTY